jgi:hypothetical protein
MTILAWENKVSAITASSETTGAPATNLLSPIRARKWRSQNLTGDPYVVTLTATLAANMDGRYPVRSIFISDINVTAPTVRIEASTSATFATKELDITIGVGTTHPIRTLSGGYGDNDYGFGGFGTFLNDQIAEEYKLPLWVRISEIAGADLIEAQYWRITISEPAIYGHTTFEAGVIYIGNHYDIPEPWEFGITEELIDPSVTERSEGGTPWTDILPHYLKINGRASIDGESTARLFERLAREAGEGRDMWTVWYPDHNGPWARAIYGRFQQLHAQRRESARVRTINFEFEESL